MPHGCLGFQRTHRRDFFRVGGLSVLGLAMADLFRARARAESSLSPRADQMILVWLPGGPPHIDTFDMKPLAPPEIRGEFRPIPTNVPGIDICELMPRLARIADKYTVLRSCTTGRPVAQHGPNQRHWLSSGNPRENNTPLYPTYGSVMARFRPAESDVPGYIALDNPSEGTGKSYLGSGYAPLTLSAGGETANMLTLPEADLTGFNEQVKLAEVLNRQLRQLERVDPLIAGRDQFQQKAFDLLRSPKLRQALDLSQESPRTIDRYVCVPSGVTQTASIPGVSKKVLLARRLIEAGVPFVQLNFMGWDFHSNNFAGCRRQLPPLDAAVASLIEDLDERGLLERTVVAVFGEMGRTPWYQGASGRDHWRTQSILVAGGGFKRGTVVGTTDKHAAEITDNRYSAESFARTVYTLLGIDPDQELHATDGRPLKIVLTNDPLISEAMA